MVFVADVARAALRACVTPGAAGQEMIVAGPRAAPLREILSTLARALDRRSCGPKLPLWPMLALAAMTEDACGLLGVKPPIYRRRMDFYRNDAGFDCSRAFDVLGWRPAVDLDEGFGRTIASYRSEGLM
jgi:nucleoside-diphosphate-sugar epimerase